MHRLRTHRAIHGWTVLLAFLFGLFAPALSHALARSGSVQELAYMAEICSASGTRHVMVFEAGSQHSAPALPDMAHCDLCCQHHAGSLAPPPHLVSPLIVDGARDSYPALFYHAPSPQFAWSPTQSRGPPSPLS